MCSEVADWLVRQLIEGSVQDGHAFVASNVARSHRHFNHDQ